VVTLRHVSQPGAIHSPPVITAITDHERLHLSPGRFMKCLPVERLVTRNKYTFQVVDPTTNRPYDERLVDRNGLWWSSIVMREGFPEGQTTRHGEYKRKLRALSQRNSRHHAVSRSIRTYTTPVIKLAQELGVPRGAKLAGRRCRIRFPKIPLSAGIHTHRFIRPRDRSHEVFGEVLLSYFDEWAAKRVPAGIGNVDERTIRFEKECNLVLLWEFPRVGGHAIYISGILRFPTS